MKPVNRSLIGVWKPERICVGENGLHQRLEGRHNSLLLLQVGASEEFECISLVLALFTIDFMCLYK